MKYWIVNDALSKSTGCSLNECLLKDFDKNIFDLLLQLHTYKIAVTANVEKAFLVIFVPRKTSEALI